MNELGEKIGVKKKVFISHSSKNKKIVEEFIELIETIGLDNNQLFCSSIKGYDIPAGKQIYEYLRQELNEDILSLLIISNDFYESKTCMCEMGAIWVQAKKSIPIIVPPLSYNNLEPEGIFRHIKSVLLTDRDDLDKIKDEVCSHLDIKQPEQYKWERHRDSFLKSMNINILSELEEYKIDKVFRCYSDDSKSNVISIESYIDNNTEISRFNFDFNNNNAGWCSCVILFNPSKNWEWIAENDKKLNIIIRGGAGIDKIWVELRYPNGKHIEDENDNLLNISNNFKKKTIILNEHNSVSKNWLEVSELCFVIHRNKISTYNGFFEIKDIFID